MPGILFDANVWVALTFSAHPFHARARKVFAETDSRNPAIFCRATEMSFLRLFTTPVLLNAYGCPDITNRDAIGFLRRYRGLSRVGFLDEPAGAQGKWLEFAEVESASPKMWMDAYLAAFAISGNLSFISTDGDFRRFEERGLKLRLLTE